MARISEAYIRSVALSLPGAYEHASHDGRPSWRTKPRMFTWLRNNPEALVVWVESLDAKEALLATQPDIFFTTPHYDGYAIILVRLDVVARELAKSLIVASWKLRAPASLVKALTASPARTTKAKAKTKAPAKKAAKHASR
jgi:hypothetical protein